MPRARELTLICKGCKTPFTVTANNAEANTVACCTMECRGPNPGLHGAIKRFWAKVSKGPHPKGCWLWTGALHGRGRDRPEMGWRRRVMGAARIAWIITHGEIKNALHVLHTCDVELCVNPGHLYLGTPKNNFDDMVNRGRLKIERGGRRGGFASGTR